MAKISILGLTALLLFFFFFFSWAVPICDSLEESVLDEDNNGSFFTVSSFRYPKSQVRPYDTRYIRVDLPPWFSSLNVAMESDVGIRIVISSFDHEPVIMSSR
ncbi:hypothetical protein DY000_02028835 [Brassica cretica]|uniref:Uncharacterized protein n=1 Tax=Brassica cretica TaxID=69181 RepID=A0ABQ7DDD1_BRACR|nr:hypothetical protein DY000_02028835 [Brassica cretica]